MEVNASYITGGCSCCIGCIGCIWSFGKSSWHFRGAREGMKDKWSWKIRGAGVRWKKGMSDRKTRGVKWPLISPPLCILRLSTQKDYLPENPLIVCAHIAALTYIPWCTTHTLLDRHTPHKVCGSTKQHGIKLDEGCQVCVTNTVQLLIKIIPIVFRVK